MPLLQNAKKALRRSQARASYNRRIKSHIKTAVDAVKSDKATTSLPAAFSALDKALKRGLIHRHKVARIKSQLSKVVA